MSGPRIVNCPTYGEFGGVSQHVRGLVKYSRHNPDIFPMPYVSAYHPAWSRYLGWIETNGMSPFDPGTLVLLNKLRRYDLVHLHAYPVWIPTKLKVGEDSPKVVYTVHQLVADDDVEPAERPRWRALMSNLVKGCRAADEVICVGEWMVAELDEYGVEARFLPTGVDAALIEDADGKRFARKYGLEDFALFVGSALHVKRPKLVLQVARKYPDTTFVMAGRNLDEKRCASLAGGNLPKNVKPVGELNRADLLAAYKAAGTFILPSVRDAFPTALLEGMVAELPCVGVRSGGVPEIIEDGVNGFLANPDDADDLARAFGRALEAGPDIGKRAHKHVREKYDWADLAAGVDDLYDEVLGRDA